MVAALRRKGKGSDVREDQMVDVVRAHNGEHARAQLLPPIGCLLLPNSVISGCALLAAALH
jgi:hypothetical protein